MPQIEIRVFLTHLFKSQLQVVFDLLLHQLRLLNLEHVNLPQFVELLLGHLLFADVLVGLALDGLDHLVVRLAGVFELRLELGVVDLLEL